MPGSSSVIRLLGAEPLYSITYMLPALMSSVRSSGSLKPVMPARPVFVAAASMPWPLVGASTTMSSPPL